jgi:hypothetical protein
LRNYEVRRQEPDGKLGLYGFPQRERLQQVRRAPCFDDAKLIRYKGADCGKTAATSGCRPARPARGPKRRASVTIQSRRRKCPEGSFNIAVKLFI